MIKKYLSFLFSLLFIFYFHSSQGQTFIVKGNVRANDSTNVQYATIVNTRSLDFTFSDSTGYFRVSASKGDTLEIQHIAFESRKEVVFSDTVHILLNYRLTTLDEVVISGEIEKALILQQRIKNKELYPLSMNADYLFEIKNPTRHEIIIINIIFPIRYKKGFSSEGSFICALYKTTDSLLNNNSIVNIPMEDLVDKKEVEIDIDNITLKPDQSVFLFLKRVVPNKIFNKSEPNTLSVNPFILLSEKGSYHQSSWVKNIGHFPKWEELFTWFGFNPFFDFRIEAYVVNKSK